MRKDNTYFIISSIKKEAGKIRKTLPPLIEYHNRHVNIPFLWCMVIGFGN